MEKIIITFDGETVTTEFDCTGHTILRAATALLRHASRLSETAIDTGARDKARAALSKLEAK